MAVSRKTCLLPLRAVDEVEQLAVARRRRAFAWMLRPFAAADSPGLRKWCASSISTASAISLMRCMRAGKSPPRCRSVWLKIARLLKSPPARCAAGIARMARSQPARGRLRHEEHDALALLHDQILDQHQADERLAQADAIAKEGAAVRVAISISWLEASSGTGRASGRRADWWFEPFAGRSFLAGGSNSCSALA